MTTENLKTKISMCTGVPVELLSGTDEKQIIAQARGLVRFKGDTMAAAPKPTRELFAEALGVKVDHTGEKLAELDALELELNPPPIPAAPSIKSGGNAAEVAHLPTEREQLEEWLADTLAFDPTKTANPWRRLI